MTKDRGRSRRPLGRKKFQSHDKYCGDDHDEPSKNPSKCPRKKKSQNITDEEPSVNAEKKKCHKEKDKKEDKCDKEKENTLKASKTIPDNVAAVVDAYVASHTNFEKLREEYSQLQQVMVEPKYHEKCCANKDRCRHADIPCIDETRFVLDPKEDDANSNDFIHANRVTFDNREFIVAQAPIQNTLEDFWRMVFQAQSTAIVVVCKFYEEGKESSQVFWPQENASYKYYGKMFINNKKTEFTSNCNVFTIEVLPDGCSNSLITKVYHFPTWQANSAAAPRTVLRLVRSVKNCDCGPLTVVSSEGVGRACTYVVVDVVTTRLFKGVDTKLVDIAISLRKQRALAFKSELFYIAAAQIVLEYVRAKMPKHTTAISAINASIAMI